MDDALLRRLEEIERRLSKIESRVGLAGEPPASPVVSVAPVEEFDERGARVLPPPLPVRPIPAPSSPQQPSPPPPEPLLPAYQSPVAQPQPVGYQPVNAPQQQTTLEQTIGLKWAGWIGAVVLVIGAALGFKYAYDQGWLGSLPDPAKLACLSLCGFGLIALGEFVLRRVNKAAAAGLYGAGVAMLFVASYAGHAWYGLFAENVAIGLSLASALAGVLLAARADLVSIAVLAIVGGAIAPLIIGSDKPNVVGFLTYLLGLVLMALALCHWLATAKWWALRSVSLTTLLFWMPAIIFGVDLSQHAVMLTAFAIGFAVLYHAELILTTRRAARLSNQSMAPAAGVIFSIVVTAAFVGWMLLIERNSTDLIRGGWVLGTALACAILGFALMAAGQLYRPMSQSLRVQAILLVVLAVPVLLDGPTIVWAWMLLAVGLAILGHVMRLPISLFGSIGVWALAVAAWSGWQFTRSGRSEWFTFQGVEIEGRVVMAVALMVGGHLIAQVLSIEVHALRLAIRERLEQAGAVMHVAAASVLVLGSLMLPPTAGTLMLIGYVWICLAVALVPKARLLAFVALGTIIAAAIKWIAVDVGQQRALGGGYDGTPFANWQLACGLLITLTLLVKTLAASGRVVKNVLMLTTAVLFLLVGSVELDHYAHDQSAGPEWIVRQVGWSVFWAICGVIYVILGFILGNGPLRYFALGLLGLTLLKVVIVDLSGVGTGWRILSFIGLGGVLLGTSVLYGKFGHSRQEPAGS